MDNQTRTIRIITPVAGRGIPADAWHAYEAGVLDGAGPVVDDIASVAYHTGTREGRASERQRIRDGAHKVVDGPFGWYRIEADLLDGERPE